MDDSIAIQNEFYSRVITLRSICSIISLISCSVIVIIYLILSFQMLLNKCIKKANYLLEQENEIDSITSFQPSANQKTKIGIGSHFMFMLILSNIISNVISLIFEVKYKSVQPLDNKDDTTCKALGFFETFFSLSSVCLTTLITRLFLKSTETTSLNQFQEKHEFHLGSIYTFSFSFLLSIFPLLSNSYGNAFYQCSFNYENDKFNFWSCLWLVFINLFVILNFVYNIISLWKVNTFYSAKMLLFQSQQKNSEYNTLRMYVIVFRVFPIVLVITRSLNIISRVVDILYDPSGYFIVRFFVYFSSIVYCLNGMFNSVFCLYFFRGVFNLCKKKVEFRETLDSMVGSLQDKATMFLNEDYESSADVEVKFD